MLFNHLFIVLFTLLVNLAIVPTVWCMEQPQEIELSQGDIEESSQGSEEEEKEESSEMQLNRFLKNMQISGLQFVEAIKNKKSTQEIQQIYNNHKKSLHAAENLINNLRETTSPKIKMMMKEFNELKMKFRGQLKSPLFILNEALQPETVKKVLASAIKSTKEDDIAKGLKNYYNHQLYNANYTALIYLTLIEGNNALIQEIIEEADAIAKQKLEIDKIKNTDARLMQMEILDEQKAELNAKRNLLIPLLKSLESALDFANKAQAFMRKQDVPIDPRFTDDYSKLSQQWSSYFKKIDPDALETGSTKNEETIREWARKSQMVSEAIKKTPERKGSLKDIQKMIKEAKIKESNKN